MSYPDAPEERLRCSHCGEVIGVYEAMVARVGGVPVHTSRAALGPDPSLIDGSCLHADCHPGQDHR
jgi:hypothetical protein